MKVSRFIALFSLIVFYNPRIIFGQWSTTGLNTLPGTQTSDFGTAGTNFLGDRDIRFWTLGVERMRLIGEPGFNQGFLRLGTGTSQPQSLLHLHINGMFSVPVYEQITNSTTAGGGNPTATDGFKLGITAVGAAQLIQQENNLPMQFLIQDALLGNTQVTRAEFTSGNMMTGGNGSVS